MRTETRALNVAALSVAVFFLTIAALGFVPGVTSNFDDLSFAGHHSQAKLLGIFQVSVLHNLVHLAFGLAGLALARTAARSYLIGCGLVYFAVWVYGIAIDHDSVANIVPVNTADNWLHLFFCLAMIGLGIGLNNRVAASSEA
jgi:ABC-type transport system involved in multi-copper enzyme maturation permease subunit